MKRKLKSIILNYSKKNHWMMSLIRIARKLIGRLKYIYYFLTNRVDDNMIIFESFMGRKYVDSPKAIYEYMLNNEEYKNYKFIWFFKNPSEYKHLEKTKTL